MNNKTGNQQKKGQSEQVAPFNLERLPRDVREIVEALPKDKQGKAAMLFTRVQITSSHSGPMPSPDMLARYEEVMPGCSKIMLDMAVNQQNHRFFIEKMAIKRQLNQSGTGQWIAGILAFAFLAASVYLGIHNHDTLAGVIGGVTLVGLVTVFVTGKKSQSRSLEEKN